MKKVGMIILTVIMLVCSLAMVGCKDKATDENSYRVSFYEEVYTQDEHGVVTLVDYKLNKSFTVLKTQMFELPNAGGEYRDGPRLGDAFVDGPYQYTEYVGDFEQYWTDDNKKLFISPESDLQFFFAKGQKKTIKFFYGKDDVVEKFFKTEEEKEAYNTLFVDVYLMNFSVPASSIESFLGTTGKEVKIELFTNENLEGEPFAEETFTYNSYYESWEGEIEFDLIKSTNVYIKRTKIS